MMMVIMTTVSFYLITVYTPTFGKSVLKLSAADGLIVTICVGLSNFIWLPIMGVIVRPDRPSPDPDCVLDIGFSHRLSRTFLVG